MEDKDKSLWQNLTSKVGGKRDTPGTVKQLDTHTRRCPQGHPMAVDWTECPYCKANRNASHSTKAFETSGSSETRFTGVGDFAGGGAPAATGIADPPPPNRRTTRVFEEGGARQPERPAASGDRTTKMFTDPADKGPIREPAPPGRPLSGVLYTFTWTRLGQLFHVYAGRNFAGTAGSTREGEPIEILVDDATMSGTHFLILNQAGKYRITDWNSTNGTFVDGQLINPEGNELKDDARIMAGNTMFVFKKILPPAAGTEQKPADYNPVEAPRDDSK
jgi:hypothetical protein